MEIQNLSWNPPSLARNNSPLLPKSIRGVVIGKSGCGKTTLLLNLLLQPSWLDYNNLLVYGKSLFQPEYKIMREAFNLGLPKEVIMNIFKNRNKIVSEGVSPEEIIKAWSTQNKGSHEIQSEFFESADDVLDPSELNPQDKNLMVFDDLMLESQSKCEKYYIRGRHSNVDCFYLCQNYFKLPRQTIRENANFFCLFPQDAKNVNHIYNDHVSRDMSKDEFKRLCNDAWELPHGFVTIDLSSSKNNGKYRSCLDNFYIL